MARERLTATFKIMGDQFAHAWFFNRFRCDLLGGSILVTTALVSDTGGTPAVNGFVLSKRDLELAKERSLKYLAEIDASLDGGDVETAGLVLQPSRVYPINYINLSRMDETGEICLYRYSMNTLLLSTKHAAKGAEKGVKSVAKPAEAGFVPCYPVVMFRSDLPVHIALLKELFSL